MTAHAIDGWVVREGDGYLLYVGTVPPREVSDLDIRPTDKVTKVRLLWEEV